MATQWDAMKLLTATNIVDEADMAENESKFKREAWILYEHNLIEIWNELGRVSNNGSGNIKCEYKDGGSNKYTNPQELVSNEANSRNNAVIKVSLARYDFERKIGINVMFSLPPFFMSNSIHIWVEKEHEDAKADLVSVENVVLNTRPRWWWLEPLKLGLNFLELVWKLLVAPIAVTLLTIVLLIDERSIFLETEIWSYLVLFGWILIYLVNYLCRWLWPVATTAFGEGMRREEDLKMIRKIVSWICGAAVVLIIIASRFF